MIEESKVQTGQKKQNVVEYGLFLCYCVLSFSFKLSHVKTLQEYFWIEKLRKSANSLVNQEGEGFGKRQ